MLEIYIIVIKETMRASYGMEMNTSCFTTAEKAKDSIKENGWSLETHAIVPIKLKLQTV